MPALYVLDVAEWAPLIASLGRAPGASVERRGGYAIIAAPGEIVVERSATGLAEALWFGALTGGFAGEVVEFSGERLHLK